ncbi:MAG: hypothetical protein GY832_46830 [Chloroflexi bacterium]|nr:hypothetical protein [Chloroflexota bacterium]
MNCPSCGFNQLPKNNRHCPKCGHKLSPTTPVVDFSAYITDRTRDFVGRDWVFALHDQQPYHPMCQGRLWRG